MTNTEIWKRAITLGSMSLMLAACGTEEETPTEPETEEATTGATEDEGTEEDLIEEDAFTDGNDETTQGEYTLNFFNEASEEELYEVDELTDEDVQQILEERPFSTIEELRDVGIVDESFDENETIEVE